MSEVSEAMGKAAQLHRQNQVAEAMGAYGALMKDPEPQFKALCEFLGVAWPGQVPKVAARSVAIQTASVWQVREPLYSASSGRSRRYFDELKELRQELADLL